MHQAKHPATRFTTLTRALLIAASAAAFSTATQAQSEIQAASAAVAASAPASSPLPPSELYGELYREVQLAHVYPDSKTFADMTPNVSPQQVMIDYANRTQPFDLARFVGSHFTLPQRATKGYASDPNESVTQHIDTLWTVLRRNPDANASPWSSLLPLPYAYVVPGDRFDEIYYWDSYFIMLGLRQSGQRELMKNELDNFATLIDRYGHIPNGNRSYYLSRSQPPFFAQMVQLATETDGDSAYLRYLPELAREYAYWMDGENKVAPGEAYRHVVRLSDGTLLNRYWDDRATPRDESYREDVETAKQMPQRNAEDLWRNLRAGGETGWDFSSRWFSDGKSLATIEVTSLAPVDLNALLYDLERTLARAYRVKGDAAQAEDFEQRAHARAQAIRSHLWDPQLHAFGDYDFVAHALTHRLSAATVYPLYAGIATKAQASAVASTIRGKLLRAGGLATTTVRSGQQWDEPNGWAPLQYLAIMGLRRYGESALARQIAERWIQTNVAYYQHTGKLVEKYDVDAKAGSTAAGGGEYPLQDGFGWTNGVLRTLMVMYPSAAGATTRPVDVPSGAAGVADAAASAAKASKNTHRLAPTPSGE
ncbi:MULTISPECIES: alpha,alpha-trehalase TreF [unclassified Caballeronia]|uniref:alpha,alpha-trehalase TreF n=1 Tax=unclassified Caballeronia TaxID=2646786 RepID=UPI002029A2EA|nr:MULTISPECIES: alpha,alpha-trehalase TreF [unclassified Caballeronia]